MPFRLAVPHSGVAVHRSAFGCGVAFQQEVKEEPEEPEEPCPQVELTAEDKAETLR